MDKISNFLIVLKDTILEKFSDLYFLLYTSFNKENINKMNQIIKNNLVELNNSSKSIIYNKTSVSIMNQKDTIINEIIKNIQLKKYLSNYLEKIFPKIKEEKSKYINILVIGESGIGKSTLINRFLKINKAEEGIGESKTKKLGESYISDSDFNKDFQLFDSYGFSKEEDFKESINNIVNFIDEQSNKKDLIHCIWYCFNGKRYSDKDRDSIKKLLNKYKGDYLPIIIIHLQTINIDESKEYFNKLKEFLGDDSKKINFISVLAKDLEINVGRPKQIIKNFGLDELKVITKEKISQAEKSYYFQNIRTFINHNYSYQILNKYLIIKGNIEKMINNSKPISMLYFDVEKYFIKCLHLLSFNADDKLILSPSLNKIYRQFIDEVNCSYINEFNSQIYKILEEVFEKCFPSVNETFKNKDDIYFELIKELRTYIFNEEKNKEIEENVFYDTTKDLKNNKNFMDLAESVKSNEIKKETDIFDTYDEAKILNDSKNEIDKDLIQNKNSIYKIDTEDISKLRHIEFELHKKLLTFFSLEILNCIYDTLKNELKNELNTLIDEKISILKKSFLPYSIMIKPKK